MISKLTWKGYCKDLGRRNTKARCSTDSVPLSSSLGSAEHPRHDGARAWGSWSPSKSCLCRIYGTGMRKWMETGHHRNPDRVWSRNHSVFRASFSGFSRGPPFPASPWIVHPDRERDHQACGRTMTELPPAFSVSDALILKTCVRLCWGPNRD